MKGFFTGPSPTVVTSVARRLVNDGYSILDIRQPRPDTHEPGFVTFEKKGYTVRGVVKILDTIHRYDEQMIRKIMEAERNVDSACRKGTSRKETEP